MSTSLPIVVTGSWTLVYDASASGQIQCVARVLSGDAVVMRVDTSLPDSSDSGIPLYASGLAFTLSARAGEKLYARSIDGASTIVVDSGSYPGAWPPSILTSTEEGFARIRADVGQTGLYEGREFRMVRKVSVVAGTPLVFRFTSAVDFILLEQSLNCSTGDIEFYAWRSTQGAAGGTFTALPVPPIGKNIGSTRRLYSGVPYASQVSLASGGTFTPTDAQVYVDYDRAKTSGATAQQVSVQGGNDSVRYLAAGTYYLVLTSLDGTSVGRLALAWEERIWT